MKQLSRLDIQRMIDTSGSAGSGGSGGNDISLAGYATEAWVEENYLSKEFFLRLFGIHGTDENDDPVDVEPNDPDTTITDIEAMFGFWTEKYISALGQGSGGGGGGGSDTLADLIDVELTNPAAGQVLKYNGTKWVNSAASAGTVTSVGMSVPTGFTVTGSPITVSGVLGLSFAAGYSLPTTAKQTNWDAAYSWTSVSRTTLADYGITDAKFGTPGTDSIPITLGPTTKSVLTQHQSLANYYTKSETDGKFLTISFFRSLFKAYNSSDVEVQPNDGNTATITNIKAMFGFWTEQYISALGQSSGGGGGVTLNQPLLGINQAGLSAPSSAGLGLVFNGSAWVYTNAASMSVYGLTVSSTLQAYNAIFGSTVSGAAFSATGGGFSVSGKDNTYVLLAGGGTKLLSEIGGGGAVNSITLGQGGTNYTPDASGIITLPPYPSKTSDLTNDSGFITGYTDTKNTAGATNNTAISLYLVGAPSQTANPETYTRTGCYISSDGYLYSGGSKVLTSVGNVVTTIALNGSTYSPQSGVVSLPAYPSKTSDLTNDSGFITGYTDTKNTAGATDNVNTKLFLIGSTAQGANPQTYSNQSCYIGTDNCLYSGGSKVMTAASGYLPLTGGTLTGQLKVNNVIFGYNYTNNPNAPAFVFDKPGSHYTGIGGNGTNDTIFFGAVKSTDFSWNTSYKQKWNFNGTIQQEGNNVIHAGNIASQSVANATTVGDGSVKLYAEYNNEINFGGTFNGTTMYFSYRAKDSRNMITKFMFGGVNATATVQAGKFIVTGGYSTGFLKADGSVDNNTYITSGSFLPLSGGAMTGTIDTVYNNVAINLRAGHEKYNAKIGYRTSGNEAVVFSTKAAVTSFLFFNGVDQGAGTSYTDFGNPVLQMKNNKVTIGGTIRGDSDSQTKTLVVGGSTLIDDMLECKGLTITTGSGTTGGAVIPRVTIGQTSLNTSYTLLVDGSCRINNLSVGSETTVQSTSCATLATHSSRGIYVKTGTAPNYVDGSWSNASDMRLKDIVSNIGCSVDDIANAPIFNFRWKAGGNQVMVGTSAQYWQNVLPNTVTQAFNGYLYMDYSAAAIAAAVITARKVQNHEGRLQILERENEALRREIQILKSA